MMTDILERNFSQDFGLIIKSLNSHKNVKIVAAVLAKRYIRWEDYQGGWLWDAASVINDKNCEELIKELKSIGFIPMIKGSMKFRHGGIDPCEEYSSDIYYRNFIKVNERKPLKELTDKINSGRLFSIKEIAEFLPCFYSIEKNPYFKETEYNFGTFIIRKKEQLKEEVAEKNKNSFRYKKNESGFTEIFFPSKSFAKECYKKLNEKNYFNNLYGGDNNHHNYVCGKIRENRTFDLNFGCQNLGVFENPYKKSLED